MGASRYAVAVHHVLGCTGAEHVLTLAPGGLVAVCAGTVALGGVVRFGPFVIEGPKRRWSRRR